MTDELFQHMFPNSKNTDTFACGSAKCSYLIRFGLGSYFEEELLRNYSTGTVVAFSFDESLKSVYKRSRWTAYCASGTGKSNTFFFCNRHGTGKHVLLDVALSGEKKKEVGEKV